MMFRVEIHRSGRHTTPDGSWNDPGVQAVQQALDAVLAQEDASMETFFANAEQALKPLGEVTGDLVKDGESDELVAAYDTVWDSSLGWIRRSQRRGKLEVVDGAAEDGRCPIVVEVTAVALSGTPADPTGDTLYPTFRRAGDAPARPPQAPAANRQPTN